jgi:hypothetical protein
MASGSDVPGFASHSLEILQCFIRLKYSELGFSLDQVLQLPMYDKASLVSALWSVWDLSTVDFNTWLDETRIATKEQDDRWLNPGKYEAAQSAGKKLIIEAFSMLRKNHSEEEIEAFIKARRELSEEGDEPTMASIGIPLHWYAVTTSEVKDYDSQTHVTTLGIFKVFIKVDGIKCDDTSHQNVLGTFSRDPEDRNRLFRRMLALDKKHGSELWMPRGLDTGETIHGKVAVRIRVLLRHLIFGESIKTSGSKSVLPHNRSFSQLSLEPNGLVDGDSGKVDLT